MVRLTAPLLGGASSTKTQSCWGLVRDLPRLLLFIVSVCCGVIFSVTLSSHLTRVPFSGETFSGLRSEEVAEDAFLRTHSMNESFHRGEGVIAEKMSSKVRVLCLVYTTRETYKKKGHAVKTTWGNRCNTLLFVSNFEDSTLPVLKLLPEGGKLSSWALTKAALSHVNKHIMDFNDWVLRADDATFVVMENLRYLLSQHQPSHPLYLGCRFKKYVQQGFMSGGAGYVLSKEAVRRMVDEGLPHELCAPKDDAIEDVEMGKCMESLGVRAVDTRDSLGRGRFFPFSPEKHIIPGTIESNSWYWDMVYYPPATGHNCCSDTAISFHDVSPERMHVMNYFIYHLRPYGINHNTTVNETDPTIAIK